MLVGMFAFSLWDREEEALYLVRDRLGEKPLYYGLHGHTLLFTSELKALWAYPKFQGEIDRNALTLFLYRNMIPAPHSIYKGIFKLPAGTWLKITSHDIANTQLRQPAPYWSLSDIAVRGQKNLFRGSLGEASVELERLLTQSLSNQVLADVPLGAFLSGGVDSSTIVALMQAQSSKPIRTFTIGFHESDYDEAQHGRAVASHLGTEHTELFVTPDQALDLILRLPVLYDEPFADASQIPTFFVIELARRHVIVCLSGDGGDELFGGYNRHLSGARLWRRLGWLPQFGRVTLASALTSVSPSGWDSCFKQLNALLPRIWRHKMLGDKLHKLCSMLSVGSQDDVYDSLVAQWSNPERVVIGSEKMVSGPQESSCVKRFADLEHRMMFLDTTSYLPDNILVKVDRAAMSVSLETRIPMLDHRIVEFAWTLPLEMKIQGGKGKRVLRHVLSRYLPRILIERPKSGFSVPTDNWLRGPLKPWADELLNPARLKEEGFFDPIPIQTKWMEHVRGERNWSSPLWGYWLSKVGFKSTPRHLRNLYDLP